MSVPEEILEAAQVEEILLKKFGEICKSIEDAKKQIESWRLERGALINLLREYGVEWNVLQRVAKEYSDRTRYSMTPLRDDAQEASNQKVAFKKPSLFDLEYNDAELERVNLDQKVLDEYKDYKPLGPPKPDPYAGMTNEEAIAEYKRLIAEEDALNQS